MKLVICLITKGREEYLGQILQSFEGALLDPDIKVLILDNGASKSVGERLRIWQENDPNSVRLVRLEMNDSRPAVAWNALFDGSEDWVVFPSDDDEFRPEIIKEWHDALHQNPSLVGFATAAAVMDESGVLTGEVRRPSISYNSSHIKQIASAFHEPPFHWPSLFFRRSKLPVEIPNSRFAFDWWVGVNLLLAGDVKVSDSIGINYRVHSQQESSLAPLRRKCFEAQVWLGEILSEKHFKNWLQTLNDTSKLELWDYMNQMRPIYGDTLSSAAIIEIFFRQLLPGLDSSESATKVANDFALSQGVLLRDDETKNLMWGSSQTKSTDLGNIRVEVEPDTCKDMQSATALICGSQSARIFKLYCKHSTKVLNSIIFDCSKLISGNTIFNADLIVNELTLHCEKQGDFEFTLTNGEKMMINLLRDWKARLPLRLQNILIRLKNSNKLK